MSEKITDIGIRKINGGFIVSCAKMQEPMKSVDGKSDIGFPRVKREEEYFATEKEASDHMAKLAAGMTEGSAGIY